MVLSRTMILMIAATVVVSVLAVTINVPSTTPYSPYCTGPEGYSELVKILNAVVVYSPADVSHSSDAVILLPLERDLSSSDYLTLKNLVVGGATLIIADEGRYSDALLSYLGVHIRVANYTVLDEVRKLRDRFHPVINVSLGRGRYAEVTTFMPSYILEGGVGGPVLGYTSKYAYADVDGSGFYSLGEVMKEYLIVGSWHVGNGTVVLVRDLDAFSNSLIGEEGNVAFIRYITGLRKAYLVVGGLRLGGVDELKLALSAVGLGRTMRSREFLLATYLLLAAVFAVVRYSEKAR